MINPRASWSLLCVLLMGGPLPAVVTRAEHSRECVMCHITWGDNYEQLEKDLAPPRYDVMVDGLQERNSSEEMCWSCHDGFVLDDREAFEGGDPHLAMLSEGREHGELPLDRRKEMYCGTCHTPHSHKMGRKLEFSPFLRSSALDSKLCLECHADHKGGRQNHPLHAPLKGARGKELARANAPAGSVECLSCHDMHRHQPVRRSTGKDRGSLCATCHPGDMAVQETDHDLRDRMTGVGATGAPLAEGDACAACHAMHDAPDKVSIVQGVLPGDGQCRACHSPTGVAAEKSFSDWGHPLGESAIQAGNTTPLPLAKGAVSCSTCHNPHRWASEEGAKEDSLGAALPARGKEGTPATSFLRVPDTGEGRLCTTCHGKQSAIVRTPHGSTPLYMQAAGSHGWACSTCHVSHGSPSFTRQQGPPGSFSAATRLCLSCHAGGGAAGGKVKGVGEFSHPVGRPFPVGGKPPWLAGPMGEHAFDLEGDKGLVGCESCHDPHRWNPTGLEWTSGTSAPTPGSFLRVDPAGGVLCKGCHSQEARLAGSLHDFQRPEGQGGDLCARCHQSHRAGSEALLARSLSASNLDSLLRQSDWAPGSPERSGSLWQGSSRACLTCHNSSKSGQLVPEVWAHPTHVGTLRPDPSTGQLERKSVDCTTCHNPHQAPSDRDPQAAVSFLEGTSQDRICSDCHREDALPKYQFFHDRRRRR